MLYELKVEIATGWSFLGVIWDFYETGVRGLEQLWGYKYHFWASLTLEIPNPKRKKNRPLFFLTFFWLFAYEMKEKDLFSIFEVHFSNENTFTSVPKLGYVV